MINCFLLGAYGYSIHKDQINLKVERELRERIIILEKYIMLQAQDKESIAYKFPISKN